MLLFSGVNGEKLPIPRIEWPTCGAVRKDEDGGGGRWKRKHVSCTRPWLGWMYRLYASDLIFHHPSCCISSGGSPPLSAVVAALRLKECPENMSLIPRLLVSDLSLAVKYFFVKEPAFKWKSGVEGCRGDRVYKFQGEVIAHASSFEAAIVSVTPYRKRSVLEAGR